MVNYMVRSHFATPRLGLGTRSGGDDGEPGQTAGQLRPDEAADSEYRYRYIVMPMRI